MLNVGNIYAGLSGGGGGGTVTNALNGTHLNTTTVYLGGPLLESTTVTGSTTAPLLLIINPGATGSSLSLADNGAILSFFTSSASLFKQILAQSTAASGIVVQDDIDALGLMGLDDFTDPTKPLQYLQRVAVDPTGTGLIKIVASVNKEGQTAAVTMLTFTPSAPGMFRVNVYVNYNSGSGAVSGVNLQYTDIRSHSYNTSLLTSNVTSGNTGSQVPPQVINAASGTAISLVSTITGTISYDYVIVIEQLPLPPVT